MLVGSQESRAVLRWTILKTRCLSSYTSQSRGSEPILLSGGAFQCERQLIKDMNFWGWTEMWCSEEGLGSMFRSCNSCSCTGPLGWAAPLMLYTTYNTICNNIVYIIMIIYDIKLRMILFSDQPSLSDWYQFSENTYFLNHFSLIWNNQKLRVRVWRRSVWAANLEKKLHNQ